MEAGVRVPSRVRRWCNDRRITKHAAYATPFPWAAAFRRGGRSDARAFAACAGPDPRPGGKNLADRRRDLGKTGSDSSRDRAARAERDGGIGAANLAGIDSRAAKETPNYEA